MRKVDGHTHTHYCPHGSGDHVEKMIQQAISLGFDEYHITEHSPLPKSFSSQLLPKSSVPTLTMEEGKVDEYLKEMLSLKEKYKQDLIIKVGFEMDYLPEQKEWTKAFLQEYGPYCDTGILSVHFMKGKDGWRNVDYKAEDTKVGLVDYLGGVENFQLYYYDYVQQSILEDLGPYKPTRIGHMTLCNKFKHYLHVEETPSVRKKITETLQLVKEREYLLDYNMAGFFKPYCKEAYPPHDIVREALDLGIPLLYGSDAHGVKDVGRGYDVYGSNLNI